MHSLVAHCLVKIVIAKISQRCECSENKCAERSLFSGCYCYIENKAIKTDYMPASKKCSDLLNEIGHHDGMEFVQLEP